MKITTKHNEIGYPVNVAIIEAALRERFGIDDNSAMMTALAQHVWSGICGSQNHIGDGQKQWGTEEIQSAFRSMQARMNRMTTTVAQVSHDATRTLTLTNGGGL